MGSVWWLTGNRRRTPQRSTAADDTAAAVNAAAQQRWHVMQQRMTKWSATGLRSRIRDFSHLILSLDSKVKAMNEYLSHQYSAVRIPKMWATVGS